MSYIFNARYKGECAECGLAINAGQEIMPADEGGYVHVNPPCPDSQPGNKPTRFEGTSLEEMGF